MTDSELERLGRSLQHHRKRAGMSLRQLAEEAGYSHQHLHKVEAGQSSMTLESLARVAEALDIESYLIIKDAAL